MLAANTQKPETRTDCAVFRGYINTLHASSGACLDNVTNAWSANPSPGENGWNGCQDDLDIKQQRAATSVFDVQLHHLVKG